MSGFFFGEGNVGKAPALRYNAVNGEQRAVLNMSVRFDHRVQDDEGVYKDEGGFWAAVSYWGKRAEHVAKLLKKGARVSVQGEQFCEVWADEETGEEKSRMKINASFVGIDPLCVESVTFKKRSEPEDQPQGQNEQSVSLEEAAPYEDDITF